MLDDFGLEVPYRFIDFKVSHEIQKQKAEIIDETWNVVTNGLTNLFNGEKKVLNDNISSLMEDNNKLNAELKDLKKKLKKTIDDYEDKIMKARPAVALKKAFDVPLIDKSTQDTLTKLAGLKIFDSSSKIDLILKNSKELELIKQLAGQRMRQLYALKLKLNRTNCSHSRSFIESSLPFELNNLTISGFDCPDKICDISYYLNSLIKAAPKVTKQFQIYHMKISADQVN